MALFPVTAANGLIKPQNKNEMDYDGMIAYAKRENKKGFTLRNFDAGKDKGTSMYVENLDQARKQFERRGCTCRFDTILDGSGRHMVHVDVPYDPLMDLVENARKAGKTTLELRNFDGDGVYWPNLFEAQTVLARAGVKSKIVVEPGSAVRKTLVVTL